MGSRRAVTVAVGHAAHHIYEVAGNADSNACKDRGVG